MVALPLYLSKELFICKNELECTLGIKVHLFSIVVFLVYFFLNYI